jgi:hypothetical protein
MARRIRRPVIETPSEKAAFRYGIELAAEVAKDYDKYSYHSHLVSECILGKLNVMKGRPQRNPRAVRIMKALDRLEHLVDGLEGPTRFMTWESRQDKYKEFLRWAMGVHPKIWDQLPEEVRKRWQALARKR